MAAGRGGGADTLRAAAADLELIAAAREAVAVAETHLAEIVREVKERRLVTVDQIGEALGVNRRSVYKRLARD